MILKPRKKPTILIILDGWGIAPSWGGNAITQAKTPVFDNIWRRYPSTTLLASGEAVGLPTNSPGNSEAGHLNLGAGHIIRQDQTLIDDEIESGKFGRNEKIVEAINHAQKNHSAIHLMGLLSKTGTHSHIQHLFALLNLLKEKKINRIFIHLFSDGRDSDPMSGVEMIDEVERKVKEIGVGQIASVSGRFYAMDRDNRWGRVARAYNLLVKGEGETYETPKSAFTTAYAQGITDEFIEPRLISNKLNVKATISDNDSIILYNFRSDRVREMTRAFLDPNIPEFPDRKMLKNLYFASFVVYDNDLLSQHVFSPERVSFSLAQVWSSQGLKQFHISETEKYPHVTYFINGGIEKTFPGEERTMIPSPRNVKTYDFAPKMSADKVTSVLAQTIKSGRFDSIVVNFANADMVGHTGNLSAAVQAVSFVDECLGKVLNEIISQNGSAFIVADHGNAEQMVNPVTGDADTEHTTNPVPFIIVSEDERLKKVKLQSNGVLASVAPTILAATNIPAPETMRNQSLIIKPTFVNEKV